MKFNGRLTAFILVLITNGLYILYYYLRDGYVGTIEIIGLPIILLIAWWAGKQYDKVKLLEERDKLKSKELERSNKLFRAIYENAPIGIALIDKNGRPIMANTKLQEILGYTEAELRAMTFNEFSHIDDAAINKKLLDDLLEGKIDHYTLEKRYFRKDGEVVWGSVTSALFPDCNGETTNVIGMVDDITKRKSAEQNLKEAYQELEHLSKRDGLTGIANRRYFADYINREYTNAVRDSSPLTLIMIDIDFFKQYNDAYGHLAGDECLKQVASTLEMTINNPKDLVARFGGEEFIIVLPETDKVDATMVAKKIQSSVEELQIPHISSLINNYLTVSIGISTLKPDSHTTPETLIMEADKALYQAKKNARNRIEIYSNEV